MSDTLTKAVEALNAKLDGETLDGSVKFEIEDVGSVRLEGGEATVDDGPADCTITASADTFQEMMDGDLNPTSAFMTGRIKIDGDMGAAMKLASVFA